LLTHGATIEKGKRTITKAAMQRAESLSNSKSDAELRQPLFEPVDFIAEEDGDAL
jgi:hypothetical protein